jgi:predicted transposase YbfD/YdcC
MEKKHIKLLEAFASLPDPRVERAKRHSANDILFIAITTLLTGGRSFYDMEECGHGWEPWFREILTLENGIPSHDTFNRFFQMLDPVSFEKCFRQWAEQLRLKTDDGNLKPDILAIDGKAHRRTASSEKSALHAVNVWASRNRLILGQLAVETKSNEITAVPQLLKDLLIKGCIVTSDALNCQKDIVGVIVERKADYVLAIKGNHKTAYEEIKLFMDGVALERPAHIEHLEKDHGRIEYRRYWQSDDIDWFADKEQWVGLKSFAVVERISETADGKVQTDRRYYISSLKICPELIAEAIRSHWGVENNVHWCLDVVFGEDQSRARTLNAAKNLGLLRNMALNILRQDSGKKSLQRKMYAASLCPDIIKTWLGF